jgi:organic radical activating enzyme
MGGVMSESTLLVSEVFGPTLQGEGPTAGQPCVFVRLGLCNLDCVWCDTPFTWDWTGKNGTAYDKNAELRRMYVGEIVANVNTLTHDTGVRRVVISGGEPFVHARKLDELIEALVAAGYVIEIETNGTLEPSAVVGSMAKLGHVQINCSPKLAHSGIDHDVRIRHGALAQLAECGAWFKFVVASESDVAEVMALNDEGLSPIMLMPEGRTADEIAERWPWVFDIAARLGWAASTRLHVLAHNDKRGI